jgi:hypothetical protein
MLNIENYDQWAKVCDDDELILDLYNSGIRPGTDEFKHLLGNPVGNPAGFKDYVFLVGGLGLTVLSICGLVKLVKLSYRKVKQFTNKKFHKQKEEP